MDDKRDEVIRAAAAEFAERGYAGASFGTIATRLGATRSYVQHYVSSKPELAAEIAWLPFRGGGFLLDPSLLTGGRRMILQLARMTSRTYANDVVARASTRLMNERAAIPAELPVPYEAWREPLRKLIEEAVEDGDLRAQTDAESLAWRIIAAFAGTKLMCETTGQLDLLEERAVETVTDLLTAHGHG